MKAFRVLQGLKCRIDHNLPHFEFFRIGSFPFHFHRPKIWRYISSGPNHHDSHARTDMTDQSAFLRSLVSSGQSRPKLFSDGLKRGDLDGLSVLNRHAAGTDGGDLVRPCKPNPLYNMRAKDEVLTLDAQLQKMIDEELAEASVGNYGSDPDESISKHMEV